MLNWGAPSASPSPDPPLHKEPKQDLVSKGVRNRWEGWCEYPEEGARVGAGLSGTWTSPEYQRPGPSSQGNHQEQEEADSQVEVTGFSG